jgi:hypothetical protein
MPALTIDDFTTYSVTCEIRYSSAYFIYDRTGQFVEDLRGSFTDINVSNSSPQQTAWVTDQGAITIELGACRFTSYQPNIKAEVFANYCKAFFEAGIHRLQIEKFTRIGLRHILRKEYKSLDEARAILASLSLSNLGPAKRFNSSSSPTETLFRWEDSQIGALFRLKAEQIEIKVALPLDLKYIVPKFDKKLNVLTLDVDYYTVAPVERDQWNCQEWVSQKLRTIRKEIDGIFEGGGK